MMWCAALCGGLQGQSTGVTPAGATWERVRQLPIHSLVHVSSDKMSRLCVIDSVDADVLTCSAKRVVASSHYTFPRGEIKTIKLTRYVGSTVGGVGIGAGVGLALGVGVAHDSGSKIVGNGVVWGITAAIGAVAGGLIGGPTDFLRGPTVYRRP